MGSERGFTPSSLHAPHWATSYSKLPLSVAVREGEAAALQGRGSRTPWPFACQQPSVGFSPIIGIPGLGGFVRGDD